MRDLVMTGRFLIIVLVDSRLVPGPEGVIRWVEVSRLELSA